MRKRVLQTSLPILGISLLLMACVAKKTVQQIPLDEMAFIEYYVTQEGKAIKGEPPQGRRIDGPTYHFDPVEGTLNSYINTIEKVDELIAVIGTGRVLRGTEGGGLSSRIVGVSALPYSNGELIIEKLSNKEITVNLRGESFSVPMGEAAKRIVERTDTIPNDSDSVIIQKTITYQISYKGVIKKNKLILPKE